jgi:hypothetical protein
MMKPDIDIDTEKYSGHNIHNNMFIKTFSDPENMKIFDFPEMNIERRKNGVMGHLVKKISYYTFPPTNHTFSPLNYKFPLPK